MLLSMFPLFFGSLLFPFEPSQISTASQFLITTKLCPHNAAQTFTQTRVSRNKSEAVPKFPSPRRFKENQRQKDMFDRRISFSMSKSSPGTSETSWLGTEGLHAYMIIYAVVLQAGFESCRCTRQCYLPSFESPISGIPRHISPRWPSLR